MIDSYTICDACKAVVHDRLDVCWHCGTNMLIAKSEAMTRQSGIALNSVVKQPQLIDWQRIRVKAAIAAMNSLITSASLVASQKNAEMLSAEVIGTFACQHADALIAELRKEVAK